MPLTRRRFLAGSLASVVGATALSGCGGSAESRPPNILMLCIDDLRDWVGYLGTQPGTYTPNLDALAASSFSFDRAYCSVPVCRASRPSVLWGWSPVRTGVFDHLTPASRAAHAALWNDPDATASTLPKLLADGGYQTLSTGKVFHDPRPEQWDVYAPYERIADLPVHPSYLETLFSYGVLPPGEVHTDQKSADWVSEQLGEPRTQPFFMAVGLYQPHLPWLLPQWAFDLHPLEDVVVPEVRADDLDDVPAAAVTLSDFPTIDIGGMEITNYELVESSGRAAEHVQAYMAAVSHTDAMVGQILDSLDRSPHADNTVMILWSDHGYHLGEKLHWRKGTLWEQANRIPLLIRGPGFEAGGRTDQPVSMLDLAPTVLSLAGLDAAPLHDGHSLLHATDAELAARPPVTFWEGHRSVRSGPYRYTRYADGSEEFYDHRIDPREHDNAIAGVDPALLSQLRDALDRY